MLQTIITQEVVEEILKCKINKVDGELALVVPVDCSQADFDKAVRNLIARGKRNFSQGADSHAEASFTNLVTGTIREKLPEMDKATKALWAKVLKTLKLWSASGKLADYVEKYGTVEKVAAALWTNKKFGNQASLPDVWDRLTKNLDKKVEAKEAEEFELD